MVGSQLVEACRLAEDGFATSALLFVPVDGEGEFREIPDKRGALSGMTAFFVRLLRYARNDSHRHREEALADAAICRTVPADCFAALAMTTKTDCFAFGSQ
ncbi:MAG: hypothetical protein ACQES2_07885 [Pseudomonadota bacterium]